MGSTVSVATAVTHLRAMEKGTYMADLDVGEMFLNFPLDPVSCPNAGADLTHFQSALRSHCVVSSVWWERWERQFMALKPSPFNSVRFYYWGEEFARDNWLSANNPMRWIQFDLIFQVPPPMCLISLMCLNGIPMWSGLQEMRLPLLMIFGPWDTCARTLGK
jgi:hypothetical protein